MKARETVKTAEICNEDPKVKCDVTWAQCISEPDVTSRPNLKSPSFNPVSVCSLQFYTTDNN